VAIALAQCAKSPTAQRQTTRLMSQGGALTVDLTAATQQLPLAGQSAQLLAYNGQVPGPLWEVQAGDTVVVPQGRIVVFVIREGAKAKVDDTSLTHPPEDRGRLFHA